MMPLVINTFPFRRRTNGLVLVVKWQITFNFFIDYRVVRMCSVWCDKTTISVNNPRRGTMNWFRFSVDLVPSTVFLIDVCLRNQIHQPVQRKETFTSGAVPSSGDVLNKGQPIRDPRDSQTGPEYQSSHGARQPTKMMSWERFRLHWPNSKGIHRPVIIWMGSNAL